VVILRIAYRTDCAFEFDQHGPIAKTAGVTEDAIAATCDRADIPDCRVGLLVRLADDIVETDSVRDDTWADLAARWTPEQLVELLATATFFRMAAALINALGVRTRQEWT
jgi:alkylhydroperoxidase family enzyme